MSLPKYFCIYIGIDLNDLMLLGQVANDDEKDTARKAFFMYQAIKKFQNSFMELERVNKKIHRNLSLFSTILKYDICEGTEK